MGLLSLQMLPSSAAKSVGTHKNHQRGKVWQSAGDIVMSLSNRKITEFLNLINSPVLGQSMTEFFQESNWSLWSLGTKEIGTWLSSREVWGGRLYEKDYSGSSLPFPAGWATVTMSINLVQLGEKKKKKLARATCYVEEVYPWKAGARMGKRLTREYGIQRTNWAVFWETSLKRPEAPQEKTRLRFQEQKVLIGSTNGPVTWKSFWS